MLLLLITNMAVSPVSRVRTRLNNRQKHGKKSKKTTRRATSAIWKIYHDVTRMMREPGDRRVGKRTWEKLGRYMQRYIDSEVQDE